MLVYKLKQHSKQTGLNYVMNIEMTDLRFSPTINVTKQQFCLSFLRKKKAIRPGIAQWCARVIFVESDSSESHEPFESETSQSHLKFCRVESRVESWLGRFESESSHKNGRVTSSHWFTSSSQCRVI